MAHFRSATACARICNLSLVDPPTSGPVRYQSAAHMQLAGAAPAFKCRGIQAIKEPGRFVEAGHRLDALSLLAKSNATTSGRTTAAAICSREYRRVARNSRGGLWHLPVRNLRENLVRRLFLPEYARPATPPTAMRGLPAPSAHPGAGMVRRQRVVEISVVDGTGV